MGRGEEEGEEEGRRGRRKEEKRADVWLFFRYRSVPLIRPPILYTTSSPKRGGGVFSSTQLVSIIRSHKKFCYVYGTAKVHVHSYKSTNDRQYCSWSSCVVSLHWREELPLQLEGHNIHDAFGFAVAILKNSNSILSVMNHGTFLGISCGRVAAR